MKRQEGIPMTIDGKEKLEQELAELMTRKRQEVIERIKWARTFCDFSEDSEYDAAMKEREMLEDRINELENIIHQAKVITSTEQKQDQIDIGHEVVFRELPKGEEEQYMIVGKTEANIAEGKISNESPLAKSLLGHTVGDKVHVKLPTGKMIVEILHITSILS